MAELSELTETVTQLLVTALKSSLTELQAGQQYIDGNQPNPIGRPPPFSISEYRSSEGGTVEDYFKRFDWALALSKISGEHHANYARVYMGVELNNALKFLVSPDLPENVTYARIKEILQKHFDRKSNKYVESIKFRQIKQDRVVKVRLWRCCRSYAYRTAVAWTSVSRFVCDEIIAKNPETFDDAYKIAHTLEATRSSANDVKNPGLPSTSTSESTNNLGCGKPAFKYKNKKFQKQRATSNDRGQASKSQTNSKRTQQTSSENQKMCNGCGQPHPRIKGPFRDAVCHQCNKKGHIAKVCRSETSKTNQVSTTEKPAENVDVLHRFGKIKEINGVNKRVINVQKEGHDFEMELDTGAPCGIVNQQHYDLIKTKRPVKRTNRKFVSYSDHPVNCLGYTSVDVSIGKTTKNLHLYVVDGDFDALFGREWIEPFVNEINFVDLFSPSEKISTLITTTPVLSQEQENRLNSLLSRYEDIFSNIAGKLIGPPAKLHLKPGAPPVFSRPREIPLALHDAYAKAIDEKIVTGFFERVDYSEWASTTHVVPQKKGTLRITGNYKPTLNPQTIVDEYPIPKSEHLFSRLRGANLFCHLDITDAYTHLTVDEEFRHALTLNTPTHGLIRPTRAVYGAASIPAIWQRRIEVVLKDLPNVLNFFDDLLIFANDFEELLISLDRTLDRLKQQGLHLNRAKCVFATPTVEFLGHKIDQQGIHKSDRIIEAKPTSPEQLQLFLGKATYYGAYIPDLSTKDRPLRNLLKADEFKWTPECDKAYKEIRDILISPQVLIPYDPSLPLVLATVASKTGLGAVLWAGETDRLCQQNSQRNGAALSTDG